jgi:hypothetical protein
MVSFYRGRPGSGKEPGEGAEDGGVLFWRANITAPCNIAQGARERHQVGTPLEREE